MAAQDTSGDRAALVPPFSPIPPVAETPIPPVAEPPGQPRIWTITPYLSTLSKDKIADYLIKELTVRRLNDIHDYLWLAGIAKNIRPLHRQKIMERDIVITENADLHLVWYRSRIYIKPLPHVLLDHGFFTEYLCSHEIPGTEESTLHASACGLLLSYAQLVQHQSDFSIAKDAGLLPSNMTWDHWSLFAAEVREKVDPEKVNRRYLFGELRMTRLNLIYRMLYIDPRGFHHGYTRYASFFRQNFGWLLLAFAYVTVVLAAMQTMLTSSFGTHNVTVQKVSYWFGVGSLVTVVLVIVIMLLIFVGIFSSNLAAALKCRGRQRPKGSAV